MIARLLLMLYLGTSTVHNLPPGDVVTIQVDETTVYQSKNNMLVIWIEVAEGYHIQANRIKDKSLIPTTIEVADEKNITVRRPKFPRTAQFKLEGYDTFLDVYDGKFPIKFTIRPHASGPTGKHVIPARLQYQACDAQRCLFPRTIEFSIPLAIKKKTSG